MEDFRGPTKRKGASADAADMEIPESSSDAEESAGNVHLPHLVVEKILEYLDFKDLLVCSSVNKFWNHEARRLLREKHQCALSIDPDKTSEKELMELQALLVAGELPLPYGSLSVKKKWQGKDQDNKKIWSKNEWELKQVVIRDIILRAGPFKVVQLDVKWGSNTSVGPYMIWRSVMAAVQETVEVLMIKNVDVMLAFTGTLPELKKLDIKLKAAAQERIIDHIQYFVTHAEKLKSVGRMSSRWLQLLKKLPPARKLALVKEFSCVDMDINQEVAAFAALEPKLEKLFVPRNPLYRSYQLDPTNSISMSLLLSSQASLIELQAPYEMLQEVRLEKPSATFMNLRYLRVDLPWSMGREELDQSGIIIALCPKLVKLKINTEGSWETVIQP